MPYTTWRAIDFAAKNCVIGGLGRIGLRFCREDLVEMLRLRKCASGEWEVLEERKEGREDRWCYSDEGQSFETGVGEKWVVTWVGLRLWRCRASAPED